jgi:copper type II ascorbate-dependent monooxygenase-like protein
MLVACGTDSATPPGDDAPPPPPTAPTYYQDVEPIFATNCATCHTTGGIAPFAIDDPDTAVQYAPLIVTETAARRMPPWPPGGDTPPLLHTRTLTQAQLDTIAAWADGGAQLGDPNDRRPHDPPEVVDIGPTAIGFDIGVDYVPDTSLTDDYHCFLADMNSPALRMATGFKVTPGNSAIVHHVIVGQFAGADRDALLALDAETPERAGWPCVGGLVPTGSGIRQIGNIGTWVPGVTAVAYPAGTGNPIQAGALAVIQVHYNLLGGSDPDRTRVDIALAPPEQNATLIRLGGLAMLKRNLTIPAGDPASVHEVSATVAQWRQLEGGQPFPSGTGFALGAGGHMHLIGHRVTITRTNAAGTDTLLDIPAWDFHWQGQYQYVTPIALANTDTLTLRCEYDNSAGTQTVTWGEGTQDEMCIGALQMVEQLP